MAKHYRYLRLKSIPAIDEKALSLLAASLGDSQPQADMTARAIGMPPKQDSPHRRNPVMGARDAWSSFGIHTGLAIAVVLLGLWHPSPTQDDTPVTEVTFGLTQHMAQTQQAPIKAPEGETQATKTKEDLPQLTKQAAPPPTEEDLHTQEIPKKTETKKTPNLNNTTNPDKGIKNAKPTDQKISLQEYLKRKEEDLRKIDTTKKQGIQQPKEKQPPGHKQALSNIPKSPFQSADAIPKAPPGLVPTGAVTGTSLSSYNNYKTYLANQLREHWILHEGSSYAPSLVAVVEFTVNSMGYLVGVPRVIKPSGQEHFDTRVVEALKATFPVQTPPPKDLRPPQVFRATYKANDVNG